MNRQTVFYTIGWILNFEAGLQLIPMSIGFYYGERSGYAFLISVFICFALGLLFTIKKPKNRTFFAKEGFISVAFGWIILSIMGSLPYIISQEIPNVMNAVFESVSGFSTTGTTILNDVTMLSHACLFWRSMTQFIGGMGVLVMMLAVLPLMGGNSVYLMRAESPGPTVDKLVPKVRQSAMILYGTYLGMTVTLFLTLIVFKMKPFDAICTAFSTTSTGGFGIYNDSLASFRPTIRLIVSIFMLFSGTNFVFFYLLLKGRFKAAVNSTEVRLYWIIVFVAGLICGAYLIETYPSLKLAMSDGFFHTISIITTTGFTASDFSGYPYIVLWILTGLMFIGACGASTSGGLKLSRIIILWNILKKEILYMLHPRMVKRPTFDGRSISPAILRATSSYLIAYVFLLMAASFVISFESQSFESTLVIVLNALNNVGANPLQQSIAFSDFSIVSKSVLMFVMLAGRLEIFPLLLLFAPATWRD